MKLNYHLTTTYFENHDVYLNSFHPRPNFKREHFLILDGPWNYIINQDGSLNGDYNRQIIVPFPIESHLSKVCETLKQNEHFIYRKMFDFQKKEKRVILHFDAVDQICTVYLNHVKLGSHQGGYLPFEFDVSNLLKEKDNVLYVDVVDNNSFLYPTGKQRKKRGGIFYTPTSGIWQSVWLESTPEQYVESFKMNTDIDKKLLRIDFNSNFYPIHIQIFFKNHLIQDIWSEFSHIEIPFQDIELWSPETPNLYDLILTANQDKVSSYFAFRKISINGNRIYLNNHPYFINGILDQGYYSDGIYTPYSFRAYEDDILNMKSLGFNALRKHIKIEPMRFYYLCDRLGILVLQDMVNMGKYSLLKHGVLPTLGLLHLKSNDLNSLQQNHFLQHCKNTINYLYNVPSIVYWTIFNEGWGQFRADEVYQQIKKIDSTRIVDATSGWFIGKLSDVSSYHIYFKKIKLKKESRPILISECGGYCYKIKDHSFLHDEKNHTFYHMCKSSEEFENAFLSLYNKQIYPYKKSGYLSGVIYTQLSDVEDETNGLFTYDRKVCKVNKKHVFETMQKINKEG